MMMRRSAGMDDVLVEGRFIGGGADQLAQSRFYLKLDVAAERHQDLFEQFSRLSSRVFSAAAICLPAAVRSAKIDFSMNVEFDFVFQRCVLGRAGCRSGP